MHIYLKSTQRNCYICPHHCCYLNQATEHFSSYEAPSYPFSVSIPSEISPSSAQMSSASVWMFHKWNPIVYTLSIHISFIPHRVCEIHSQFTFHWCVVFYYMTIPQFIYWWTFGWFPVFIMNNSTMTILECLLVDIRTQISWVYNKEFNLSVFFFSL